MSASERPPDRADGDTPSANTERPRGGWAAALERIVTIRPDELVPVAWSWLCFFAVLTSYYVIRPIRDDMGVAGGVENLAWLFLGTLTGMAIANPVFSFLADRLPRQRLVSLGYRFFAANLLLFFAYFTLVSSTQSVWAGRVFFVWTAVFNMFIVSLFYTVMTDTFSTAQGKRLFGFIGVAGQIGGIVGAGLTASLVGVLGPARLLLISAALLEVAAFAARKVFRQAERRRPEAVDTPAREAAVGGGAWDGFTRTAADPYLRGIAVHLVLFTVLTTFLYFQQATIVDAAITDRVARTQFFANVDLTVNLLTLVTQAFVTSHFLRIFGLTSGLVFLPALSAIGFLALGAWPTVAVLMTFQVARRSSEFSIARPSREVLYTSASQQDRYTAKNFIDTFVYRAGDQIGAWVFALLTALGLGMTGTSSIAAALSVVAILVAVWLGRRQPVEAVRHAPTASGAPAPASS